MIQEFYGQVNGAYLNVMDHVGFGESLTFYLPVTIKRIHSYTS